MAAGKFDGREASTSLRAVSPPAEEANATTSKDALGKTFGLEIKSLSVSVVVFRSLMRFHRVPAVERSNYVAKTGFFQAPRSDPLAAVLETFCASHDVFVIKIVTQ